MFARTRLLRSLAAATALCSLSGCVSQATSQALAWSQQQCIYGNIAACADVPVLQAQAEQERQVGNAVALGLAAGLLGAAVGVSASRGGGGYYHHGYYRGWR